MAVSILSRGHTNILRQNTAVYDIDKQYDNTKSDNKGLGFVKANSEMFCQQVFVRRPLWRHEKQLLVQCCDLSR